ncbi:D-2-hydroxyacid dehydrogenase [Paucilactobacillus suebicus]|nr:D-2-hydroxyacid dehydrogenase [Paucilactobacillus suebicus]
MKIIGYGIRQDERQFVEQWSSQNGIGVKMTAELLTAETVDQASGYDGIVAFQQLAYSDELLEKMDQLGIHNLSLRNVGVDNINLEKATSLGIKVTNVPVYSPEAIAEFTVTQLMQLLRRSKEYARKFSNHDFRWAPQISKELNQQTVGVIGTGHIGRSAIKIFQGFGAKVIAYDAFHNKEIESQGLYVDSLSDIYKQATVITLHIPLFPETEHMLDREAFNQMNDGVFIINAARGPLIDESALIEALDSGKVGGAALDVMEDETKVFNQDLGKQEINYPAFNNLFERDNVLISPHTAFYTDVAVKNMVNISLNNNKQLFETGTADNLVEK